MRISKVKLAVLVLMVLVATGCQLLNKKSESELDAQLSKSAPPSAPIPLADGEPQKGFEQEPAGVPNS